MKKLFALALSLCLILGSVGAFADSIVFGTAATSGTYYQVGAAIGTAISNSGVQVNVIPTAGSNENVSMAQTGDIDIGMGNSDAIYGAYNGVTTVAKQSWDKYLYMVFIGGDQPIEIIETDVGNDKVVIVLKESYGNSFVPFLTSHYSKVVIVDPRKFNTSNTPKLYLPDLIAVTGCDDLIVINYPFMPVNKYYCNRLRTLAGLTALG